MNRFAAYGCISCVNISLKDEEAVKHTKVYEELVEELHNYFIAYEDIYIDVITGSYRNRRKLNKIIKEFSYGDTIFASRIESLGFTTDEVIKNYHRIAEKGIGLLLPDRTKENGVSDFATTDFSFCPINKSFEEIDFICNQLKTIQLKPNAGRRTTSTKVFPADFEKVYWAYENYFIPLETAVSNNLYYVSRRKFYQLCDEYEKSDKYSIMLQNEERKNNISEKPKRYGKVPENFDKLVQALGSAPSEQDLFEECRKLNIPVIHPIDYKRYYIKSMENGHSIAIKCAFNFAKEIDDLYFLPKNAERMQNGY
ncbi:MAG: hypothetical protein ACI4JM_00915 [Oscillospiraceae bacterium]